MVSIYNNLTKKLEQLIVQNNTINWYTCGPTPYDYSHFGHCRVYVTLDIIRRILEDHFHYKINYGMNITDVEDKIINRSNELGIHPSELTKKYTNEFFEDMNKLNVKTPTYVKTVTDHISIMIDDIQTIIKNCYAYVQDGSVYFNHKKYVEDGYNDKKFNNLPVTNDDSSDFVLWKSTNDEFSWKSPWCEKGRPGWHLECSTLSNMMFPDGIDIHSGGIDLAFPHHENEFMQSDAIKNDKSREWVKYFMHVGHLNIDGLKMSKSLKNFIKIKEILKKYNSNQLRMYFLLHHYTSPIDYSDESLQNACNIYSIIMNFMDYAKHYIKKGYTTNGIDYTNMLSKLKTDNNDALADDMDTKKVIDDIMEFVREVNGDLHDKNETINTLVLSNVIEYIKYILTMFGMTFNTDSIDTNVMDLLLEFRNDVRKLPKQNKKNHKDLIKEIYNKTDELRDKIKDIGYQIDDIEGGSVWKKLV